MGEDIIRKQRQEEYEARLNRWADIGKRRLQRIKEESKNYTGFPLWYTEFSLYQLRNLNELKGKMYLDNEEKTSYRTMAILEKIGIITYTEKIESKKIRKLIYKFSAEPTKFLCEVYKAINGDYFENKKSNEYSFTERIILSGIAFLELPKVILELHERLPPLIQVKCFPKPKPPLLKRAKKMDSPYIEKLLMPPDWRKYRLEVQKWRKECSSFIRPVAILPKKEKQIVIEKEKPETSNSFTIAEEEKIETVKNDLTLQEVTEHDMIKSNNQCDLENISANRQKPDTRSFSLQNWTNPMTPCPYKYRKLMEKVGPMKTDEEFFDELGYGNQKKSFPEGRENLSVKMQSYLLGLETDLFKVTDDAEKLTCKIGELAKEILNSDLQCDPCCVCRQTQKTYLESRGKKAPQVVIDSVTKNNEDEKTRTIGATVMISPVPSDTSSAKPTCIPSSEKVVKNIIIAGTTTTIDGERVKQVEGFTKALEHVPHEILLPETDEVKIKNVPPCKCCKDNENKEADLQLLREDKNADLCYGRKYRPEEIPAYTCGEFKKKEVHEEDNEVPENFDSSNELCEINFENGNEDCEDNYDEPSLKSEFLNIQIEEAETKEPCKICKRCGGKVEGTCGNRDDKKSGKLITDEFSGNSLSNFLKFDITNTKCKPKENFCDKVRRGSLKQDLEEQQRKLLEMNRMKDSASMFSFDRGENEYEDMNEMNYLLQKENLDNDTETIIKSCSTQEKAQEGGPYGLKTASEEALPVERTIAYLVRQHPPDHPAGQLRPGEGKRPCRCRENRNNRKTLLYNIGGMADDKDGQEQEENPNPAVIEGVAWITPDPSIRRSDEYVPEYELYDSPYKNPCRRPKKVNKCKGRLTKKSGKKLDQIREGSEGEVNSRSRDWKNSFNDPYLTDLFIKKHEKFSCRKKCCRFPVTEEKPRKLRVMNAVCECKNERKIVKRNEARKPVFKVPPLPVPEERKTFTFCCDVSRSTSGSKSIDCDYQSAGIEDMRMKYSRSGTIEQNNLTSREEFVSGNSMKKSAGTRTLSKSSSIPIENRRCSINNSTVPVSENLSRKIAENSKHDKTNISDKTNELASGSNEEKKVGESNETKDLVASDTNTIDKPKGKLKRSKSFFDRLEVELTNKMNEELRKMANEDFISLKFPNYHKIPQLLYWISYRAKGMRCTDACREELTKKSLNKWSTMYVKIERPFGPPPINLKSSQISKLNFDFAIRWKKMVAEHKSRYHSAIRNDMLNLARDVWSTMEFQHFPDILFKQAYFTYLPSREKDADVVGLWVG